MSSAVSALASVEAPVRVVSVSEASMVIVPLVARSDTWNTSDPNTDDPWKLASARVRSASVCSDTISAPRVAVTELLVAVWSRCTISSFWRSTKPWIVWAAPSAIWSIARPCSALVAAWFSDRACVRSLFAIDSPAASSEACEIRSPELSLAMLDRAFMLFRKTLRDDVRALTLVLMRIGPTLRGV